jgi:hypothetical protein
MAAPILPTAHRHVDWSTSAKRLGLDGPLLGNLRAATSANDFLHGASPMWLR